MGLWMFWGTSVWAQTTERGVIESPSAFVSGIGFISGWKCNTNDIELELTGSAREGVLKLNPAQNMPRSDTAGVCLGEENNGFIIQVNWNDLIGYDMVIAKDNREAFDSADFTIGHTGLPFIHDKAGTEVMVVDFPSPGKATTLTWSTATQHFEVSGTQDIGVSPEDERRILANSCTDARRAAQCTVSKTCPSYDVDGEYTTLRDDYYGLENYSCLRVKTACLETVGPGGILYDVWQQTPACFASVSWTNTHRDIGNTCATANFPSHMREDQVCHDANGTVVYHTGRSNMQDPNALDNAVSCTWQCDTETDTGSGGAGDDDSDDPVTVNGYTIYSAPNMTACAGEWEPISTRQSDGTWVSGWYCEEDEEDEEDELRAGSCRNDDWDAWCSVSETCANENFDGEYTNLYEFNTYSCYRVKTGCVDFSGHDGSSRVLRNLYGTPACFTNVSWTNTHSDVIGGCGVFGAEYVCHDTDGNVVWDSDNVEDHHTLDNAVSCTWYCD